VRLEIRLQVSQVCCMLLKAVCHILKAYRVWSTGVMQVRAARTSCMQHGMRAGQDMVLLSHNCMSSIHPMPTGLAASLVALQTSNARHDAFERLRT
jgi:hypothetical protein